MQVLRLSLRIAKFLGKILLGLLLVLISAIAIVHLPSVQKQLTRKVSEYLSKKIEAKVYIQRIEFSISGYVTLQNLTVWSRDGSKLFSIGKIEVTSSLLELINGNLIFDSIRIVGLDGQLKQGEDGLNIQFILDAFQPAEKRSSVKSVPITFQFKHVQLENIDFEFTSTKSGITVSNSIGILTLIGAEYSTYPNTIKADLVSLQHSAVDILSIQSAEVKSNNYGVKIDSIDNRAGITINVMRVKIYDSDFSFHQNEILNTPKFDPSHIALKDIHINLSDILVGVRKDTVAAVLHSLSVQLPGFKVDDARTTLQWSHNKLVASGFHIISNTNELNADFNGTYNRSLTAETDHAHVEIDAAGKINPQDLSYFFSDSVMNYFSQWQSTDLALQGYYNDDKGEIKTLDLKTGNSALHASGIIGDVLNFEKTYWNNLDVNASIGSDFKRTLTPFLGDVNFPTGASLQLKSEGNLTKAFVDGKVLTSWGNAQVNGLVGKQGENVEVDIHLTGEQINIGQWTNVSEIGRVNLSLNANGLIGDDTNVEVTGLINDIEMMDQNIHNIAVQSHVEKSNATVKLQVDDPKYKSEIHSDISFAGPLMFTNKITLCDFKLGDLLHMDSTLSVSGELNSKIIIDRSFIEGYLTGDTIAFQNHFIKYALDTLAFHALLSPTASDFKYYSDHGKGKLTSNFDIRNSLDVIQSRLNEILKRHHTTILPIGKRVIKFNLELENPKILQLLGIDVDDFSSLNIKGELDEQKQNSILQATSGRFKGYGISLDTLNTNFVVLQDSISAIMDVKNLMYNSIQLGDVNFDILTKGDTAISNLQLSNDTITMLNLRTRILPTDTGTFIYPDKLQLLDHLYLMDPKNPVYFSNKNVVLNHFQINREAMHINLHGDLNKFDVSLQHVDLSRLNFLLSSDTTVINKGNLNGNISYSKHEHQLNLKADIDSLSLYNSNPLTIAATAVSDGNKVPFEFLLTNTSNTIDLRGQYAFNSKEVDANLQLDINNPEIFAFLVSGVVDEMSGSIKGETKISGPIQKPVFKGGLQFQDVAVTTVNPRVTFNVKDDRITLDNSSLLFNHFTLYDQEQHPLIVDGDITTNDYKSFSYNLQLKADDYTVMNKPDSASGRLKGVLVIDGDIKLKGNDKDTNVEARLTIKDNTSLTFISSTEDIELLKAEAIPTSSPTQSVSA